MWTARIEAHAAAMLKSEERAAEVLRKRQMAKRGKPAHPETTRAFTEFRQDRIRKAKASGVYYPKACPHCRDKNVIRAGFKRGLQRYRCRGCNRTFSDAAVGGKPLFGARWKLMCHRCGGFHTQNRGPGVAGGRSGQCLDCNRYFVQGGSEDLDRNQVLLRVRIEVLGMPKDIAEELLQQATMDVLEGKGYCWTVDLNVATAKRGARGDSWFGSDSKAYQIAADGEMSPD